jgi:hypothetical protein
MKEGEVLKNFIENQRISKTRIAAELGMTRSNLYQLFDSNWLSTETKDKFTRHFGTNIFTDVQVPRETVVSEPGAQYEKAPELTKAIAHLSERSKIDSESIKQLSDSIKLLSESNVHHDTRIDRLIRIMEVSLGILEKEERSPQSDNKEAEDKTTQLVVPKNVVVGRRTGTAAQKGK